MRSLFKAPTVLALAASLLLPVWHPLAQEAGPSRAVSTDPNDAAECQRQLNKIYGAIQQFRKQHGNNPPDKLSDLLTPDYLHDSDVLVCPCVQKRGGLQTWKKRINSLAPDDHYTSYGYEFPPVPVDPYRWRGLPKKTWREVKQRQAELMDEVVPIVRCHEHSPSLNLSVGGRIYGSSLFWEHNFIEDEHLLVILANLFPSPAPPPKLSPAEFPPRQSGVNPKVLDLTASYNAKLTDPWQGFAGNNLASLPQGLQKLDGVQFDVRGVIQLRGTIMPVQFPEKVTGIAVRQKCARIHFLHAVSFIYPTNKPQASYWIHYTSGEVREFRVVYGKHIADWWYDPRKPSAPSDASVAWTGENEAAKAYDMGLRLFHTVWENPLEDSEIDTITFDAVSKKHLAGPFVVAITLE